MDTATMLTSAEDINGPGRPCRRTRSRASPLGAEDAVSSGTDGILGMSALGLLAMLTGG